MTDTPADARRRELAALDAYIAALQDCKKEALRRMATIQRTGQATGLKPLRAPTRPS
jgi:hypothetical protein